MNAVSWFEKSAINGIRVETFKSTNAEFIYHKTEFDRKIVEDKNAPRIWTRFYDLKTHQPIFADVMEKLCKVWKKSSASVEPVTHGTHTNRKKFYNFIKIG